MSTSTNEKSRLDPVRRTRWAISATPRLGSAWSTALAFTRACASMPPAHAQRTSPVTTP